MPQALVLLILAQVWLSRSHFVFELEVDLDSVTAGDFSCDIGTFDNAQCLLYFEVFCLREGRENSQSTDENDCPLGRNTERMNAYFENQLNTRTITSDSPWPVRSTLIWLMINSTHSRKGVWILMSVIVNRHNINSGNISVLY